MRFVCGQCGSTFDADPVGPDGRIACPKCDHVIGPRSARPTPDQGRDRDEGFAHQARRAMRRRLYVVCGNCHKNLRVPARLAGRTRRCPACGCGIRIPLPEDADQRVPEALAPALEEADPAAWDGVDNSRIVAADAGERDAPRAAPEAPVAPPGEEDELDEPGAEDLAVEEPHERARAPEPETPPAPPAEEPTPEPAGPSRRGLWVIGAVVAAGLVAAAIVYRIAPWRTGRDATPPPVVRTETPEGPRIKPVIVPATAPPRPRPPVVAERPARGVVARAATDLFAADGYWPAAPDRVYWKLSVRVTAGPKPLAFDTAGEHVTLSAEGKTFASLGGPGGRSAIPIRATAGRVRLAPGRSAEAILLFDVPRSLRGAELRIRGLPPMAVRMPQPPAGGELVGAYDEQVPRNLRPLPRDAVIAAIQAGPRQTLLVTRRPDGLRIEMPEAGVSGAAKPAGGGVFHATLACGDKTLNCKLRLFDDGRGLILYLRDAPFHQLTFRRRAAADQRAGKG